MHSLFALREAWQQALLAELRPDFAEIGVELPVVRCSCSFPSGRVRGVDGQCFPGTMTGDGIPQILVSPMIDDGIEVAAILVHELIHACRPNAGHGPVFRDIAIKLGLLGPMRSTTPGPKLIAHLAAIIDRIGPYPHAAIRLDTGRVVAPGRPPQPADAPQKQTARLRKVSCPECGYIARVTRKWLDKSGTPICPCGPRMEIDGPSTPPKETQRRSSFVDQSAMNSKGMWR